MYIKIFLHYNSLKAFNDGKWVLAKVQFIGSEDIELLLNTKNIIFSYQQNGFTIRKRKWYERLFKFIK